MLTEADAPATPAMTISTLAALFPIKLARAEAVSRMQDPIQIVSIREKEYSRCASQPPFLREGEDHVDHCNVYASAGDFKYCPVKQNAQTARFWHGSAAR